MAAFSSFSVVALLWLLIASVCVAGNNLTAVGLDGSSSGDDYKPGVVVVAESENMEIKAVEPTHHAKGPSLESFTGPLIVGGIAIVIVGVAVGARRWKNASH